MFARNTFNITKDGKMCFQDLQQQKKEFHNNPAKHNSDCLKQYSAHLPPLVSMFEYSVYLEIKA